MVIMALNHNIPAKPHLLLPFKLPQVRMIHRSNYAPAIYFLLLLLYLEELRSVKRTAKINPQGPLVSLY